MQKVTEFIVYIFQSKTKSSGIIALDVCNFYFTNYLFMMLSVLYRRTTKLQKILAFATRASVVPPTGFPPAPSVQFMRKGEDDFFSVFPMANTCINCIKLPLHTSYQLFWKKFDFALGNTYGFRKE